MKSLSVHDRYLRVMQVVGSVWTLLSVPPLFFSLNLSDTSPMHTKLKFVGGGCLFVALAIYSLLFPMYYITKKYDGQG